MQKIVTFALLACGARGRQEADWISRHAERVKLLAVADPNPSRRDLIGDVHGIPAERRFESWAELLDRPRLADAVLNPTQDRLHAASTLAALSRGYHMLLEKPMATTLEECVAIDEARRRAGVMVSVCHSLRYHAVYRQVKKMIVDGVIGDVISIDQLEAVDPVHQSHSYVRGAWANEQRSTFMLLAKSCHDVDIVVHLMGQEVQRVSSFGRLTHFIKANQPSGAPHRCTDGCPVAAECPYHSVKVYVDGPWGIPLGLGSASREQRMDFVQTSKYGLCVYDTDNDVVDHQVVNFEFEGGATGTFTMTAFAKAGRQLRVHGTLGEIHANIDKRKIKLRRFGGAEEEAVTVLPDEAGSHGGGDDKVMDAFITALATGDSSGILTGTDVSLSTHAATFAAEMARREGRVVSVAELLHREH